MSIPAIVSAIRQRRAQLGLTQTELSDLADVSPRFIHDLEHAKPTVRLEHVVRVCDALGLDVIATPAHARSERP